MISGLSTQAVRVAAAFVIAAFAYQPATASTKFLTFIKGNTHIKFTADHLGLSRTYGEFIEFDGRVVIDTARPSTTVVEVTVDIASLDSGLAARDEMLLGNLWLDAQTHPTMSFSATSFEQLSDKTGKLTGDLTLRGVTQPLVLDVIFNGTASDPFSANRTRWGFSASGTLNRSDFGMDFGLGLVGDEVDLIIEAELLESRDDS